MTKTTKFIKKQKGMSMIGLLIGMSIIGFFGYVGMRVGPVYMEYYAVVKALKAVANTPGSINKTPSVLKQEVAKHFYTSYIERVNAKKVKIIRGRGKQIQIKYDVQESFIGNMDLLMHFEKTLPLQ